MGVSHVSFVIMKLSIWQERGKDDMTTYTPMMQQYLQVKEDYKDAFLFF